MKVLTIKNPWADWIIFGHQGQFKTTENRTWETLYRGRIMIHVSKELDRHAAERWHATPADYAYWKAQAGKIIGTVELYNVDRDNKTPWDEPGLFHWRFRYPMSLEKSIPTRGALGLWNYEGDWSYHG